MTARPHETERVCSIEGCGRQHAAHGLCLMHYKRVRRHGSPDYRWGGKVVGRACLHCDRPATAREMCNRHYQMWRLHGDPLYSDAKKVGGMSNGRHKRRGYVMVGPVAEITKAQPADATVERSNAPHTRLVKVNHGLRDGSKRSRRAWEHRKIAQAKAGEIVHHIDGNPTNNASENLHVFPSAVEHGNAHRSLHLIAFDLVRRGLVRFDRETGCYSPSESFLRSISSLERT